MKLFLSIAARNLLQARRRTLLLSAALGLVTLLLVILLALSQGITDNLIRSATTLSAGHVNVAGFYKPTPDDTGPILTGVAEIRRIVVENTPGLAGVIDRHRGWAKVIGERGSIQAGLSGIDITQEDRLLEVIELAPESEYEPGGEDRVTGDLRRLAEPESALIFVNQARRLGVGVGDRLTLRTETLRGTTNTADVTVVAVARNVGFMSNWSVFVPKETILDLYQLREDTSGAVMIYLDDIDRAPEVMAHLREVFEAKGYRVMDHAPTPFFMKFETVLGEDWTGQKLDLTIWKDEVSFLTWVVTAVDSVSFFLIGILVVIIAIGIMNTMWIAVRERTREIGTLRAIGMSRGGVLGMFLCEGALLGLFATTLGGGVGYLLARGIDAAHFHLPVAALRAILLSNVLHLSVHPGQVATAILLFTGIALLSTLWPAIRASRMEPITAIHHVG